MNEIILTILIIVIPLLLAYAILKTYNNNLMRQFGILAIKYGAIVEVKRFLGLYRQPFMVAHYRNRHLHIGSLVQDAGKHTTKMTTADVSVRPVGDKVFDIYKESFHTPLEDRLGEHDVRIDDAEFDKVFAVRSNDAAFVKNILSDPVKEKFFDVLKHDAFASVQLKDGRLQFAQAGLINTEDKRRIFEDMVDLLYVVADEIDVALLEEKKP